MNTYSNMDPGIISQINIDVYKRNTHVNWQQIKEPYYRKFITNFTSSQYDRIRNYSDVPQISIQNCSKQIRSKVQSKFVIAPLNILWVMLQWVVSFTVQYNSKYVFLMTIKQYTLRNPFVHHIFYIKIIKRIVCYFIGSNKQTTFLF